MTRSLVLLYCGCAALLAGCFASEGFPDDVQIPCDGAADCPDGYACHAGLGRCAPGGDIDVELPTATATIEPATAKAGDVVTVALQASEPLANDPTLTTSGPDAFELDEARTDRGALRWTFTTTISDDSDEAREVTAALRDAFGNDATVELGEYQMDNTAPALEVPPEIDSSLETDFGVDVMVILTEDVSRTPWIDIAPRFDHPGYSLTVYGMESGVEGAPQREWQGIYYRVGDEPLGTYDVVLTAFDQVGNGNVLLVGTVELTEVP